MEHTQEIPSQNRAALVGVLFALLALLLAFCLWLPENWAARSGAFALPIQWAADHLPSIRSLVNSGEFQALQAVSPERARGMLGFAAWLPLLYALFFLRFGLFDRSTQKTRLIVGSSGCFRIMKQGTDSQHRDMKPGVLALYVGVCLVMLAILYLLPYNFSANPVQMLVLPHTGTYFQNGAWLKLMPFAGWAVLGTWLGIMAIVNLLALPADWCAGEL